MIKMTLFRDCSLQSTIIYQFSSCNTKIVLHFRQGKYLDFRHKKNADPETKSVPYLL